MEVTTGLNWKGERADQPKRVAIRKREMSAEAQAKPEQL